jgi:uncharacterized transporter YbjL
VCVVEQPGCNINAIATVQVERMHCAVPSTTSYQINVPTELISQILQQRLLHHVQHTNHGNCKQQKQSIKGGIKQLTQSIKGGIKQTTPSIKGGIKELLIHHGKLK